MYARRRCPGIPVLIVSGYAPHLKMRLRVLDPAAVFVGKPYPLSEVVSAVRRLTTAP